MPGINKGKFISAGCGMAKTPCSRPGFIAETIGYPAMLVMFILFFFRDLAESGFSLFFFLLFFILPVLGLIGLPFVPGWSMDAIYENGFTVRHGINALDVLHGRHWFLWEEVARIEYGMTKGLRHGYYRDSGYFRIFTPTRSTFEFKEVRYHRGEPVEFYDIFWKKLWENCPDAGWVKRDILEGQWTNRPEICR